MFDLHIELCILHAWQHTGKVVDILLTIDDRCSVGLGLNIPDFP